MVVEETSTLTPIEKHTVKFKEEENGKDGLTSKKNSSRI